MKKAAAMILAMMLLISIAACGRSNTIPSEDNNTNNPVDNTNTPPGENEMNSNPDNTVPPEYIVQGETLEEKLQNAVLHIHQNGLSSGTVILDEEFENIHGEIVFICHDDVFNYSIYSDNFHVSLGSIRDWDALYLNNQDALENSELIQKAHDLADILFPYMDITYTEITLYPSNEDIGAVQFHMYERREGCLVNIGTLELSKSGTIISFNSSSNSFDDFKDSNRFTRDEIFEIVFKEMLELKVIMEASGGFDPGDEYRIIGLTPSYGENQDTLSPYEMYLDTIDDIMFGRAEKAISGDRIFWFVEAQVKTSLGRVDSVFDYVWVFQIDVDSGERVGYIQVVSGS